MVKSSNGPIRKNSSLKKLSYHLTNWVGTPHSIIVHTIGFIGIFFLRFLGFSLDSILLILTTAVSLEAIYLAIFIQMTVNRHQESLEDVEEDIEELQEDVEEISEDIGDIQEEEKKDEEEEAKERVALKNIEEDIDKLLSDISALKKSLPSSSGKKYLNG